MYILRFRLLITYIILPFVYIFPSSSLILSKISNVFTCVCIVYVVHCHYYKQINILAL